MLVLNDPAARPKYYYFYEWMRERIGEHYPKLPEPVMDKLLAMDAGKAR